LFTLTPPTDGSGIAPTEPDPTAMTRDRAKLVIASNCELDSWFAPSTSSSRTST
jgi:hypothetical protein